MLRYCLGSERFLSKILSIVDQGLRRHLKIGEAELSLVEGLRLIEFVTVLSTDLVSVQVLLCLPGSSIEEVHSLVEARCGHSSLASLRWLHCVVMINTALVRNHLTQVAAGLKSWVREAFSCSCGHLVVPHTGVGDGQGRLAISIMNGMHRAVSPWKSRSVEPIKRREMLFLRILYCYLPSCGERVRLIIKALSSEASTGQLSVRESKLIVLGLVSWHVPLISWDVEVLLRNWSTLKSISFSHRFLKDLPSRAGFDDLPCCSCHCSWCDTC